MKATGFHIRADREIEITLGELTLLIECAAGHYDAKVREAAIPGPRGTFHGWRVQLLIGNPEAERDDGLTVDLCITSSQADLACKALEMPAQSETDPTRRAALRAAFYNVITDCNAEYTRLNQPEKTRELPWFLEPIEFIARSIWWICTVGWEPEKRLVTIYADGFPMLKMRVQPTRRDQPVVFEIIENNWTSGTEDVVFQSWKVGETRHFANLLSCMDRVRKIANSKWPTWNDDFKVFIPHPQHGDFAVLPPKE